MHISPSKKYYIGVTSKDVKVRWNNGYGYRHQPYFYNAIKKYGWDNFEHIIIEENLTKDDAFNMEKSLIRKYKSNIRDFGYNRSTGGEDGNSGNKHSEETIRKMKIAAKGRIISEEQKSKISKTLKGRKLSKETIKKLSDRRIGTKLSEETKKKISDKKSGRVWSDAERKALSEHLNELHEMVLPKLHESRKIKVVNIDTNEIFESVSEAGIKIGKNPTNITRCCKGKRKTCGGFHWKYYEELKEE